MSAYIVDENVIQYLVTAGKENEVFFEGKNLGKATHEELVALGQMLWDENMKSVFFRYRFKSKERQDAREAHKFSNNLKFKEPITSTQIFKTARNLDYQSCAHPTWGKSKAKKYLMTLVWETASIGGPGWDDAIWGAPKGFK